MEDKPVRFVIPYPPTKKGKAAWNKRYSLNAYWAGKHYRARAKDAREIHDLVWLALKQARIRKQVFKQPVRIIFDWDDNCDCSNHAALCKMIEDALKGWVIEDDSRRYVKEIVHRFWKENMMRVTVEVISDGHDHHDPH